MRRSRDVGIISTPRPRGHTACTLGGLMRRLFTLFLAAIALAACGQKSPGDSSAASYPAKMAHEHQHDSPSPSPAAQAAPASPVSSQLVQYATIHGKAV